MGPRVSVQARPIEGAAGRVDNLTAAVGPFRGRWFPVDSGPSGSLYIGLYVRVCGLESDTARSAGRK